MLLHLDGNVSRRLYWHLHLPHIRVTTSTIRLCSCIDIFAVRSFMPCSRLKLRLTNLTCSVSSPTGLLLFSQLTPCATASCVQYRGLRRRVAPSPLAGKQPNFHGERYQKMSWHSSREGSASFSRYNLFTANTIIPVVQKRLAPHRFRSRFFIKNYTRCALR